MPAISTWKYTFTRSLPYSINAASTTDRPYLADHNAVYLELQFLHTVQNHMHISVQTLSPYALLGFASNTCKAFVL